MRKYRYEEMLPHELAQARAEAPVAYVPCGIHEWHSYHLAVGLDFLKSHDLCLRSAQRTGGVVLPPNYTGTTGLALPWTLDFPPRLTKEVLLVLFGQLAALDFKVIVALTGHYSIPQVLTVKEAAEEAMLSCQASIFALPEYELVVDTDYQSEHAALWETSLLWAAYPGLVEMDRLPTDPNEWPLAVLGPDPRGSASAAKGEEMAELIADRLAAEVKRLLAGGKPDSMGFYQRWAQHFYSLPLAFVEGNLRNTEGGFAFDVRNTHPQRRSRYLTGVRRLAVDGMPVPVEGIAFYHHGTKQQIPVSKLAPVDGFYVRTGETASVLVPGARLSPGRHTVQVTFEAGAAAEMAVAGEGDIGA